MSASSAPDGAQPTAGLPSGAVRPFYLAIAIACSILLFLLMALTVADVLGRYLLNAPLRGAPELTELMLAGVIFLGLPAATMDGEHIAVDILSDTFPKWLERLRVPAISLVSAVVLGTISWRLWMAGAQVGSYGGMTASLEIPIAPVGYFASVMCGFSSLVVVAQSFHHLAKDA